MKPNNQTSSSIPNANPASRFLMNFVMVFLVLVGSIAAGIATLSSVSLPTENLCGEAGGFICDNSSLETAYIAGLLLFIAVGYAIFSKWLRITVFWRLFVGALIAFLVVTLIEMHLYNLSQNTQIDFDTTIGYNSYLEIFQYIIASAAGALFVVMPFSKRR